MDAIRDGNYVPVALGVSTNDSTVTLPFLVDPVTGKLQTSGSGTASPLTTKGDLYTFSTVNARLPVGTDGQLLSADSTQTTGLKWITASGTGTVTSVSVVTANGFAGSVANASTTPAITLTTSINAPVLAGNGTAISAATTTGSGSTVALATSPTFVTPTLGVATGTSLALGGGTALTTTNQTGTGSLVLATSPTLTTAALGSSTATTQTPSDNSTKVATTAYVDAAVLGQNFKEAAKYATTAALATVVYANGSSGVGATLTAVGVGALSLDGSTPSVNDRVLVKNQASTFQNGIYTVTIVGTGATVFVLTRATDANTTGEFKTGDSLFVTSGTVNGSTTWAYTGIDSPVMGTDAITYVQTAGQGTVTAGNGITITGLSVAIDTSVTVDKTTAQTLTNKTLTAPVISTISNTGTVTLPTATDTLVARATTDTLTNKRVTRRVVATTQSATPTINTDNTDVSAITGLAQAITSFTTNLSGTPVAGDLLMIQITDNGTARAITWGTSFEATTVALPTTTVISTMLRVGFQWNTTASKWDCIAVA